MMLQAVSHSCGVQNFETSHFASDFIWIVIKDGLYIQSVRWESLISEYSSSERSCADQCSRQSILPAEIVFNCLDQLINLITDPSYAAYSGKSDILADDDRLEAFYRADPACERLARRLAERLTCELYERMLQLYACTPQERYETLLRRCPELLNIVALKELASYLRVRPETLSRIRGRVR